MADIKIKTPKGEVEVLTPVKAIRAKCLDCCCGSSNEVKVCTCYTCKLWPYRSGHTPARKGNGKGNPEALKKARERLSKVSSKE